MGKKRAPPDGAELFVSDCDVDWRGDVVVLNVHSGRLMWCRVLTLGMAIRLRVKLDAVLRRARDAAPACAGCMRDTCAPKDI